MSTDVHLVVTVIIFIDMRKNKHQRETARERKSEQERFLITNTGRKAKQTTIKAKEKAKTRKKTNKQKKRTCESVEIYDMCVCV